jgi:hypothetical protein
LILAKKRHSAHSGANTGDKTRIKPVIGEAGHMNVKMAFEAGLLGIALSITAIPAARSETLRIMNGSTTTPLSVPMNRAVVVEADQPFA